MPPSLRRRDFHPDNVAIAYPSTAMSFRDHSPIFSFDDASQFDSKMSDSDHMIFGPLDMDDPSVHYEPKSPFDWDQVTDFSMSPMHAFPASPASTSSQLDMSSAHMSPQGHHFVSELYSPSGDGVPSSPEFADNGNIYTHWLTDPEPPHPHSASVPIPIPFNQAQSQPQMSFVAYSDGSSVGSSSIFPDVSPFSPTTAYAALQPLPRSFSPYDDTVMTDALRGDGRDSVLLSDASFDAKRPEWASQLWNTSGHGDGAPYNAPADVPAALSSPADDAYATQRRRVQMPLRRNLTPVTQLFQSSSAPSVSHARPPPLGRSYSRRAESISESDDRDATIRKKKRAQAEEEEVRPADKSSAPAKSTLRPPKLAPSAWQLYFTDWIQRHQATSNKKLNVAQAAKEAGQEYAQLSTEEKEPYKQRSQAAKEARERELAAYMRTLTPEDIKRENAFRTAQRKAGKSRKGNIKDPNAPKKPLSAYFMFLQRIRSDPDLVREVFGDETETTKQSVLAAGKWRSMTDDERKPFLAQAEQEKLEYEAARKLYEEGTVGYGSSINFSILPGGLNSMPWPSSTLRPLKREASESESDGFTTDDTPDHVARS